MLRHGNRSLFYLLMSAVVLPSVSLASEFCLTEADFSVNPADAVMNECVIVVEGFTPGVLFACLQVSLSGPECRILGVGIREEDSVLIADQTPVSEVARVVTLDITKLVRFAIDHQIETLSIRLGPMLLGVTGAFQLSQTEGCWGRVSYVNESRLAVEKCSNKLSNEFHEDEVALGDGAQVQAFPNPANPQTTFLVRVRRDAAVELKIFDLRGRLIDTLARNAHAEAPLTLEWKGTDKAGAQVPSGVYLYRLPVEAVQTITGKFSVVR